jgi:porin
MSSLSGSQLRMLFKMPQIFPTQRTLLCILCLISFNQIYFTQDKMKSKKTFTFQNKLLSNGIDFGVSYMGEYFSNLSGGVRKDGVYLHNITFNTGFDIYKLAGIKGNSICFSVLGLNGDLPLKNTGAIQGISNIAGVNHWKLFEAWMEQNLFEDKFSILFGLYDLNSEFDVRESSGIFLNPSFGIGFDFAQSGQNGPSIFPYTSLAVRLKVNLFESFNFMLAVFDGVPGSLASEKGFHLDRLV